MTSLMGTYYHNIDAKGRMNFPTKLREVLGTTFYVTKGLDQPCLTVYSETEWERLAAKVAAIPESKGGQIRRWLFSGAGVLTPDKQGRVLIPQDLRSFAGLEKDVVVIGANNKAEIWEKYKYVVKGNREKERFKYSIIGCIFGVTAILLGNTVGMTAAGAAGAAAIWMLTQEKRKYKHARKRVLREVEKQFPEWLMNLSLQLQTDNVHVSLKKTIPDAPFILKQDLTRLVEEIEQQPNALQPYIRFMREFQIPDVLSAMKILYSMAEFGIRDMGGQIDALVQRNTVMMDRAERLKEEDLMAGVGFLVLLPMITGVVKMLADLVLVIWGILSVVNTI